jgi:hypothetical protein
VHWEEHWPGGWALFTCGARIEARPQGGPAPAPGTPTSGWCTPGFSSGRSARLGAVAVGAALCWRSRGQPWDAAAFLEELVARTPAGFVRNGLKEAAALPAGTRVVNAAVALGNGTGVTAADTVPFAMWSVARNAHSYVEALWSTAMGLGDVDTTCAIVGGTVALRTGLDMRQTGLPPEPLPAGYSTAQPAREVNLLPRAAGVRPSSSHVRCRSPRPRIARCRNLRRFSSCAVRLSEAPSRPSRGIQRAWYRHLPKTWARSPMKRLGRGECGCR